MGAVGKSTMCLQAASEDHNTLFSTCEKHLTLEGSGAYVVMLKVVVGLGSPVIQLTCSKKGHAVGA